MSKRVIGVSLSIAISVGLLVYLFSNVEWGKLLNELKRVNFAYFPLLAIIFVLSFWVRAVRWRLLLPGEPKLSTFKLCEATIVGLLATNIFPFRAGEVIRPWLLSKFQRVSFSTALASVITERAFDVVALLLFFGIVLLKIENAPKIVIAGALVLGVLVAVIVGIMILAYLMPKVVLGLGESAVRKLVHPWNEPLGAKLITMGGEFIDGLKAISSYRELLLVMVYSLAIWIIFAAFYQVGLWCFGIYPSFWVGLALTVIIALAVAAPSAPGFFGVFQLGTVIALSGIYHYEEEFALGYSLVMHAFQYIGMFILGFLVLQYERLGIADLRRHQSVDANE